MSCSDQTAFTTETSTQPETSPLRRPDMSRHQRTRRRTAPSDTCLSDSPCLRRHQLPSSQRFRWLDGTARCCCPPATRYWSASREGTWVTVELDRYVRDTINPMHRILGAAVRRTVWLRAACAAGSSSSRRSAGHSRRGRARRDLLGARRFESRHSPLASPPCRTNRKAPRKVMRSDS